MDDVSRDVVDAGLFHSVWQHFSEHYPSFGELSHPNQLSFFVFSMYSSPFPHPLHLGKAAAGAEI